MLVEVGGAVVEDGEVGSAALFLFVHLLRHACLHLLGCGVVAADDSADACVERGIDGDGEVGGVLESRLEEQGAFLGDDGCCLPGCPSGEVLSDDGVDDAVDALGVVGAAEEVAGDGGLVEQINESGFEQFLG